MDAITKYFEIFEAYSSDNLDSLEKLKFEEKLNSDIEFEKSYNEYLQIEEGIRLHFKNEFKSKLSESDIKLDLELEILNAKKQKNNYKRILLPIIAIAASITLFVYFTNRPIDVLEEFPDDFGFPVKMGENQSINKNFDAPMNAYKLEEFKKAEKLFAKIESDTSIYYSAICQFKLKDYNSAISSFSKIPKTSKYYLESQYRLAILYIHQKNEGKANEILKWLLRTEAFKYRAEAQQLIERIN